MRWASQKQVSTLRKPSGRSSAPTRQEADARRAILGIPLQRSCLMHQVVFLASLRRSPPPSASPLLNWVRPYKCGGYKAETPSLPCAARLAAEDAASPQDRILYTHPDHGVALQADTGTVTRHYQQFSSYAWKQHANEFKTHSLCTFLNNYPLYFFFPLLNCPH